VSDVSDVRLRKAELRAQVLARRSALPADQRTAAARLIRDAVLAAPQVQMAGTIAAYYSIGTEPDTHGLVFALWKRGSYVLLPVLRPDGDLDWASYEGPGSLVAGPRGLREPGEPPCWCPRWRSTGPAAGSAAAAAATTARWPGSARWSR
jgi:5-formyltetrahydrofolate cyclo-ligase